ncbi:MAG: hypothetical protein R3A78_00860 [Polyangiales bacterium]
MSSRSGGGEMARIEINQDRWPLVVFTVPEVLSEADIVAHFERLGSEVFPRGRYASVMDARETQAYRFLADLRRYAAARYREHAMDFAKLLIAEAYVLESSVQRGVLTAIRWLAPASWPTRVFATTDEAEAWCAEVAAREPGAPSIPPRSLNPRSSAAP